MNYKPGDTVQIGGDSLLKDYLACVVADVDDEVFCVTLGTGNLAGFRHTLPKDILTLANDWKGPWPGEDVNLGDKVRLKA